MSAKDLLEKVAKLNADVEKVIAMADQLSETVGDIVNEIQLLMTTEAEAEMIEIYDPDGK